MGTLHSTALTNGSHLCQVDFGNPNINFCSSRSNIKSHFSTFSPCKTFRVAMYMYITSHVHAMSKAPNYSTLKITASHIHSPVNQVSWMAFHEMMELPFKIIHLRKCVFLNRKKKNVFLLEECFIITIFIKYIVFIKISVKKNYNPNRLNFSCFSYMIVCI